ncbi:alanine racemase [Rheinheimera sp. 4Y26]|uniref:alanine racemase n=1 Tax=Rheinheimera sp. 4Y26 TaxID=2977811 RepID=UPI0021B0ADF4|nr:alanine racemase [Rheinheimera sp. 4Y26]MCT6701143.1 alanine racemase [Rheinheimera sp. 4Y26]
MSRRPIAQINVDALAHNFKHIQSIAPKSKILAVLKANAYGHGLLAVAEQLKAAGAFGVARIDEALMLRVGGIVKPIVLLEGFFHPDELPQIVASNLQVVVHHRSQVEALLNAELEAPVHVWLKIDSGMHRLGIYPAEFKQVYQQLMASPNVLKPLRLMTHFACADEPDNPATTKQLALFSELINGCEGELSIANSAGVLAWPQSHGDWVRPGLALYGVSPMLAGRAAKHGLRPVMTFSSSVIAVRDVKKGDAVGYGAAWTAPVDTRLAVVAIGYGDGYPRNAPSGTPVLINGKRFPIVGRVSMDMTTIDIGSDPVNIGDQVILWGEQLAVEEIAELVQTIPYELLCNITSRVQLRYIGDNLG